MTPELKLAFENAMTQAILDGDGNLLRALFIAAALILQKRVPRDGGR